VSAPNQAKPASGEITAEVFCDRLIALSRCPWAQKFQFERTQCVQELGADNYKPFREKFGPCVVGHSDCDEVATCISASADDSKQTDMRACEDRDPGRTVGMPKAEWERRKGAGVTKFSGVKTTKDSPVEVCGIPAENEWLVAATCNDGSHPFHGRSEAEGSRSGNVGEAGRCGSIIDLYKVKCPEATYEIYLDGYVCPLSQ
jgi:hypothetical protein